MSKPWTTSEEEFIRGNRDLSIREIALLLDRTYGATRTHISRMISEGRLAPHNKHSDAEFHTKLSICVECGQPRSTCDAEGVCRVCRHKVLLEQHKEKMYRSYDNLPAKYKKRSAGEFNITRNKRLMSTNKELKRPATPSLEGLDPFYRELRLERWYKELEAYELAVLKLDIDVVKQRRTKWDKKTREFAKKQSQQ